MEEMWQKCRFLIGEKAKKFSDDYEIAQRMS
jgi:hypothetical protein